MFIASLISISSIGAGRDERKQLFGRVSTISTYSYEAKERFGELSYKHLLDKRVIKYDQKGQIIHESFYFANGESKGKKVYDFDSSGTKIKARYYDRSGGLTESDYLNGLVIECRSYNSSGELESKNIYRYDNVGKITQEIFFDGDGKITSIFTNEYDEIGNLIEVKDQCFSLNYTAKSVFKYNEYGFVIEELSYDSNGKLVSTYRYEYDEYDGFGNWTIQRHYSGTELRWVEEREILYYY